MPAKSGHFFFFFGAGVGGTEPCVHLLPVVRLLIVHLLPAVHLLPVVRLLIVHLLPAVWLLVWYLLPIVGWLLSI